MDRCPAASTNTPATRQISWVAGLFLDKTVPSTRYRTVKQLSHVDAGYIAGLSNGQGTVALSRKHRSDNQLSISISSTEPVMLESVLERISWVSSRILCSVQFPPPPPIHPPPNR
jgi:hypothetical protein